MAIASHISRQLHSLQGFDAAVHDSGISIPHAEALYRAITTYQPQLVIEVGMANGASTLAILSAIRDVGREGKLLSIDPYQSTLAKGQGMRNVQANDLVKYHTLLEKPDYVVLPELLHQGVIADFAYIDGWHTFDYTLLDFFYVDKLLRVGGIVGFNDCGLRAVNRVLKFLKTHRKYKEIDVGLKREYRGRNVMYSLMRRILILSNTDQYFQKEANWEPAWNYYARF